MKKYYKTNSWATYNVPHLLKERGVDDAKKLPNFHYREDALKLWEAIEEFVKEILENYYHSDDDLKKVMNTKIQTFFSLRSSRNIFCTFKPLFSCFHTRVPLKIVELGVVIHSSYLNTMIMQTFSSQISRYDRMR